MGLEEMTQKAIAKTIQKLRSETDPKKIEKLLKSLKGFGMSQEDLDALASGDFAVQHTIEAQIRDTTSQVRDKGYKKGNFNSGEYMYVLACTHQIRAKKAVGVFSKGMLGKTVWCDVCGAERVVTSKPSWVT